MIIKSKVKPIITLARCLQTYLLSFEGHIVDKQSFIKYFDKDLLSLFHYTDSCLDDRNNNNNNDEFDYNENADDNNDNDDDDDDDDDAVRRRKRR